MRVGVLAFCATLTIVTIARAEQEQVLVARYNWLVARPKTNIIPNFIKQLNTPKGKVIIGLVAPYLGVSGELISIGVANIPIHVTGGPQDFRGVIQSPVGYTICYARPFNPNLGAGDKGIETHGDTTFNATVLRVIPGTNQDGLAWYMVVPQKVGTDTRVHAPFEVVWVKADPGWETRYKNCKPTGEHSWLARNNHTIDPAR